MNAVQSAYQIDEPVNFESLLCSCHKIPIGCQNICHVLFNIWDYVTNKYLNLLYLVNF